MASKVWTAAELEQLSPAELKRHKIFEASIVIDLEYARAALVARARSRVERLIAETDTSQPG